MNISDGQICPQPEGVVFFNHAGWVKANDGTWSCGLLIPIGRVKADGEIFQAL